MAFLTIDDKRECLGYYNDGELVFSRLPLTNQLRTWKYNVHLHDSNAEFANLYVDGKDFGEVCPEHLNNEWSRLNSKFKAFVRSFIESKMSLDDHCFYELVPKRFIIEYSEIKCKIIDHIFETIKKPADYILRSHIERLITDISLEKLNLNFALLDHKKHDKITRDFISRYSKGEQKIIYDQFNSKTGRLTTKENSFPVLTINKQYRDVIQASNDFLIEIDYNAAEVRTFLALCGQKQPDNDIHEWNMKKFGFSDRDEAKINFIAWMYGKKSNKDKEFRKIYNTDLIKDKYWDGSQITNHYGKKIQSDEFHAVNYVVQSTTAMLALSQAIEVKKILKNCQSKIIMLIHDSIVIDMKKEEKQKIQEIIDTYTNTEFGKFKACAKIGKNLGNMRNFQ